MTLSSEQAGPVSWSRWTTVPTNGSRWWTVPCTGAAPRLTTDGIGTRNGWQTGPVDRYGLLTVDGSGNGWQMAMAFGQVTSPRTVGRRIPWMGTASGWVTALGTGPGTPSRRGRDSLWSRSWTGSGRPTGTGPLS